MNIVVDSLNFCTFIQLNWALNNIKKYASSFIYLPKIGSISDQFDRLSNISPL